jgi:hypothetical protein
VAHGQRYEYVAEQVIEIPPGSGQVAYAEGQAVPAEAVENLGIQDKVRSAGRRTSHSSTHQSQPAASQQPPTSS